MAFAAERSAGRRRWITEAGELPTLVLSAVDTTRRKAMGLYPARLISASTEGMHAELLRFDPLAGAPCLRLL